MSFFSTPAPAGGAQATAPMFNFTAPAPGATASATLPSFNLNTSTPAPASAPTTTNLFGNTAASTTFGTFAAAASSPAPTTASTSSTLTFSTATAAPAMSFNVPSLTPAPAAASTQASLAASSQFSRQGDKSNTTAPGKGDVERDLTKLLNSWDRANPDYAFQCEIKYEKHEPNAQNMTITSKTEVFDVRGFESDANSIGLNNIRQFQLGEALGLQNQLNAMLSLDSNQMSVGLLEQRARAVRDRVTEAQRKHAVQVSQIMEALRQLEVLKSYSYQLKSGEVSTFDAFDTLQKQLHAQLAPRAADLTARVSFAASGASSMPVLTATAEQQLKDFIGAQTAALQKVREVCDTDSKTLDVMLATLQK